MKTQPTSKWTPKDINNLFSMIKSTKLVKMYENPQYTLYWEDECLGLHEYGLFFIRGKEVKKSIRSGRKIKETSVLIIVLVKPNNKAEITVIPTTDPGECIKKAIPDICDQDGLAFLHVSDINKRWVEFKDA